MTTIEFFLFLLALEILILFIAFNMLVVERLSFIFKSKAQKKNKAILSNIILHALKRSQKFSSKAIPKRVTKMPDLLLILETFDQRFSGGKWEEIKRELAEHYLCPLARKWAHSIFWRNRHFAARIFALSPEKKDSDTILRLMKDRIFLVESIASLAAVKMENFSAIKLIIQKMSRDSSYSRYFYRDLLLQGSNAIFLHIEKMLDDKVNPEIHIACLDVLSAKMLPLHTNIMKKDIRSKDPEVRLAAIKVYAHNLQKESFEVLADAIDDSYPEIRKEAAYGLANFSTHKSFLLLKHRLTDEDWQVRLQAAKSLKKLGTEGINILKAQTHNKSKTAHQVASYVLHSPIG